MRFTQGPWHAEGLGGTGIWFVRTNVSQLPLKEAIETVVFDALDPNPMIGQTTYIPNAEANARLIAAAPEMYDLLQRLAWAEIDELKNESDDARALLEQIDGE